jgi:hypothetical protein
MFTQIWLALYCPDFIPDFVNPCVTPDFFQGKKVYILEVDIYDPLFYRCKTPDNKCKKHLTYHGFIQPTLIYRGLRSEMFIGDEFHPPKLSSLLFNLTN